ncbi:hypothetical protein LCGC14_2489380, partial [marine sediment metagenome]
MELNTCHFGDCRDLLKQMASAGVTVQTCVTSPPYLGLRDYGHPDQIGMESPLDFLDALLGVFRSVRDILSDDGTLWLNLGDSYNSIGHKKSNSGYGSTGLAGGHAQKHSPTRRENRFPGLKHKDLIGVPWRVAFALQSDGWYLRSDIIWSKPNPMPESVTDRPTKSHEYIFLLSKSERYYYDHEAIREPATHASIERWRQDIANQEGSDRVPGKNNGRMKAVGGPKKDKQRGHSRRHAGFNDRWDSMTKEEQAETGRNKRTVWTVPTQPYQGAHFAVFPRQLIEPCILAGSRPGDVVLDPFMGSG